MSDELFGEIADKLQSILNDACAKVDRESLKSRLSEIASLNNYRGYEFTDHDRINVYRAACSVEGCIGPRNSCDPMLLSIARKDIHIVRYQQQFKEPPISRNTTSASVGV